MNHRLFVARQVIAEVQILLQRLAHAGHVAVPKDPPHSGKECRLFSVTLDVLISQKVNERLSCG